jgi:hypothetical protein
MTYRTASDRLGLLAAWETNLAHSPELAQAGGAYLCILWVQTVIGTLLVVILRRSPHLAGDFVV